MPSDSVNHQPAFDPNFRPPTALQQIQDYYAQFILKPVRDRAGLRVVEASYARKTCDARVLVEAGDTDQPIAGIEGDDQLGERRRQGHDAMDLGWNRWTEVLVVGRTKGGTGNRDGEDERSRRHCEPNVAMTKSLVA